MIIGMEITATAIWLGPMRRDGGKVADIVAQVDYCESYTEEAKQRQLGYAKTLVEAWNTRTASAPVQSDAVVQVDVEQIREILYLFDPNSRPYTCNASYNYKDGPISVCIGYSTLTEEERRARELEGNVELTAQTIFNLIKPRSNNG